MQLLNELFKKSIDRHIDGVIKADDQASLRSEVEEYVITSEVEKRLEALFDAYNNYAGANGVWISGFFGSGKSHLLKILALLLEDSIVEGRSVKDEFKDKCHSNPMLSGAIDKALSTPSESILFNIDQKADLTNKQQPDALISVFVKVFDEHCGYFGKQAYIAQFERDLDKQGKFELFKEAYQRIANKTWETGRETSAFEIDSIAKALATVNQGNEENYQNTLDTYRKDYKISIEDFANQVQDYINKKPKGFRLNFFVDEVGQYIADNVKLMTNLQTVAESLATKCNGKAWIFVTAQEEMDKVIGDLSQNKSNDFSKIQDRYRNRLKLTSANVEEVIQRRLLLKNDDAVAALKKMYQAHQENFQTLFTFGDGTATYKRFQDEEHFINSYPFIPYQYGLFQSAIQNLSDHNAFEGKHSSVGERSMLGVFRQVVLEIKEQPLGELATFDLMFAGISSAVISQTQRSILRAENHLENPFALRLLKALFLVKYIKEFKASARNLSILMLENFSQDIVALSKQVEEALNLLEQQTYIQRNGELYEFLTDAEQDVENEIKQVEIDNQAVLEELERQVFANILKETKIRYNHESNSGFGQDYPFTRKVDDRLFGRSYELGITLISPYHEHSNNPNMLETFSAYSAEELLVVLPPDNRLLEDLLRYKRTEKYISQNLSSNLSDSARRIIESKAAQNQERQANIKLHLEELLSKANILLAGSSLDIPQGNAHDRLVKGFYSLINRTYTNLNALQGVVYSENDIAKHLNEQDGLFGSDAVSLTPAETEVFAYVQGQKNSGLRTTVKTLVSHFERKPFGWPLPAILCNLAKLHTRGKVEVRKDGTTQDNVALEKGLRNTIQHEHLILEPQQEFTNSQVNGLKNFYSEFFDSNPRATEAKPLAEETKERLTQLVSELLELSYKTESYPFLQALSGTLDQLKELRNKSYEWFLTELRDIEDDLFDAKEDIIKPIRSFMSGSQSKIYSDARGFLQAQDANSSYLNADTLGKMRTILSNAKCYLGDHMKQLKQLHTDALQELEEQLKEQQSKALHGVKAMQQRMQGMDEYQKLPEARQIELDEKFKELGNNLSEERNIPVINDRLRNFEENHYQRILQHMVDMAAQLNKPASTNGTYEEHSTEAETAIKPLGVADPKPSIVALRTIKPNFNKALLTSEQDLDEYLNQLRAALKAELDQGKRVQV